MPRNQEKILNKDPSQAELLQLWATCASFIEQQKLSCGEYVCYLDKFDNVSHPFIDDICKIVGYAPSSEEEDDD